MNAGFFPPTVSYIYICTPSFVVGKHFRHFPKKYFIWSWGQPSKIKQMFAETTCLILSWHMSKQHQLEPKKKVLLFFVKGSLTFFWFNHYIWMAYQANTTWWRKTTFCATPTKLGQAPSTRKNWKTCHTLLNNRHEPWATPTSTCWPLGGSSHLASS